MSDVNSTPPDGLTSDTTTKIVQLVITSFRGLGFSGFFLNFVLSENKIFFQFITTDKTKARRGGGKVSVI